MYFLGSFFTLKINYNYNRLIISILYFLVKNSENIEGPICSNKKIQKQINVLLDFLFMLALSITCHRRL
jgi:hypothetical protein